MTVDTKALTWDAVAYRMRNATHNCQGFAAVTIRVLVDQGRPVAWLSPKVMHIEPKGDADTFAEWVDMATSA